ncbi:MAG: hypothetical protein IPM49_18425 [Flavobacteriales bacterium]|nr:hypothetical protein [Flavobacteriales bacterium]
MAEVVVAVKSVDRGSQNIQSFGDKLGKLGMSALGINSAMQVASAAMNAFTGTVQGAWRALGEGAALTTAQGNFERLAGSIGTTADALRNDLTAATQGMVSQAQLMASASELMALGLTRTHDQTVRLGSVAGQLGWNMQHLILELNNMSGLRLDALGLELDKVKAKAKEFEAAGMSAKEAYAEAVITMGEQKLDIIQLSDAEKAMRQLTTAAEDAGNAFKIAFAQGLAGDMQDLAGGAMAMGDSWKYAAEWAGQYAAITSGFILRGVTASGMRMEMDNLRDAFLAAGGSMAEFEERYKGIFDMSGRLSVEQLSLVIQQLEADIAALKDTAAYANPELRQMEQWGGIPKEKIRSVTEWTDEAKKAALAAAELSDFNISGVEGATQSGIWAVAGAHIQGILDAAEAEAAEAADKIAQEHQEAAAAIQEAYTDAARQASSAFMAALKPDAMPDFGNVDAMRQSAFDMAGAFGLSVPILADMGVQMGVIDEKTAEAAAKAGIFQLALQNLFGQLAAGNLDVSGFIDAYDALISDLQSKSLVEIQVELKQVENPARDSWAWLPAEERVQEVEVGVKFTPEQSALQTALGLIDGIPDNNEKLITFGAEYTAVTDATDTIQKAITAIDATVAYVPDTKLVNAANVLIDQSHLTVIVDYVTSGTPEIPHRAGGGPVSEGSPYWVGEVGPELFVPWTAGTIIPHGRSGGGKSGDTTINLNVNFSGQVADPRRVVSSIKQGLSDFYADLLQEGVNW